MILSGGVLVVVRWDRLRRWRLAALRRTFTRRTRPPNIVAPAVPAVPPTGGRGRREQHHQSGGTREGAPHRPFHVVPPSSPAWPPLYRISAACNQCFTDEFGQSRAVVEGICARQRIYIVDFG